PSLVGSEMCIRARALRTPEEDGESYRSLILQTLTHRLAEAANEYLHRNYPGIRPAVGYPSLPDQKLNHILDRLLDTSEIGITMTENGAMHPSSTVSGLYIFHPDSRYFMIGDIGKDQMDDYATRRGLSPDEIPALLGL
ncbi:MAG: hypothetical protein K2G33_03450, partial [Duncaniella sp.]|nr:hypothetical protein [Duncaniella sp.]